MAGRKKKLVEKFGQHFWLYEQLSPKSRVVNTSLSCTILTWLSFFHISINIKFFVLEMRKLWILLRQNGRPVFECVALYVDVSVSGRPSADGGGSKGTKSAYKPTSPGRSGRFYFILCCLDSRGLQTFQP